MFVPLLAAPFEVLINVAWRGEGRLATGDCMTPGDPPQSSVLRSGAIFQWRVESDTRLGLGSKIK